MRRQWMAMLSMIGLATPAVRVQSQQPTATPAPKATRSVPPKNDKGSKGIVQPTETKGIVQPTESKGILISGDKATNKLNVKQQTLRQQNQGAGRQGDPLATIDTLNKGQKNNDLSRTCGNNALTKAKGVQGYGGGGQTQPGAGSQALTRAKVVKGTDVAGGGPGTKNSQALTKGNAVKGTDVAGGGGGTKNSQALTKAKLNVNQQTLRQQNQAGRNAAQTTINTTDNNAAKTVNNNAVQTTQNNGVPK